MSDSSPSPSASHAVQWVRTHRFVLSLFAHILLFAFAWLLAFGLAYNFKVPAGNNWLITFFLPLLIPVIIIKMIIFWIMGLDRAWWRYVGLRDVFSVMKAAWLSFLVIWGLCYCLIFNPALFGLPQTVFFALGDKFPDSVFVLDFAGTIAFVCGARLLVRLYHEEIRPVSDGHAPRLLILGAGNSGENVVREILRMPELQYHVVGFLDDDPAKHGARIHGLEVFGPIRRVKEVCDQQSVDELLIAMPSATKGELRRVVEQCQGTNLRFKTIPAMADLIAGRAKVSEIRDVDINDLLGRDPVTLDVGEIGKFIVDRVVMVTGAGGSIGSEMCRQIALFKPRRLVLVEQAEQHLFEIERELIAKFPGIQMTPCIADIADQTRIECLFELHRPTAVFHAAAHKHVPMMEHNPGEALKNNVHGTRVVADAALKFGCEKFVMISTDKAVNPTSIMGASKRIAEIYIQGLDAANGPATTQFVTVRFGNVLGSSGSVIPIFKQQIAAGGPVTVTHPEMVRYFMTIPEAAQLVLQAASMGAGGEIFVLDMGEPVKIVDLARDLITLSGFRPDEDIKIEFTGIRPGEKLYEEVQIEGEDVSRTAHPKIGIWRNMPCDRAGFLAAMEGLLARADYSQRDEIRTAIKQIVPEFHLETPAAAPSAAGLRSESAPAEPEALEKLTPHPQLYASA